MIGVVGPTDYQLRSHDNATRYHADRRLIGWSIDQDSTTKLEKAMREIGISSFYIRKEATREGPSTFKWKTVRMLEVESICCQEQTRVSETRSEFEGLRCITEHIGFQPLPVMRSPIRFWIGRDAPVSADIDAGSTEIAQTSNEIAAGSAEIAPATSKTSLDLGSALGAETFKAVQLLAKHQQQIQKNQEAIMAALQGLMERTMEQELEPVTSTPRETRSGEGQTCEWLRPGSADICSELSNQTLQEIKLRSNSPGHFAAQCAKLMFS
ncbi:hypothetical protein Bbelb_318740 [Branchiostoma belcheri]|nr:hypothetical protein Bbelb_318740 [Branchiostoma belcheri]